MPLTFDRITNTALISKANLSDIISAVGAGQTFTVTAAAPTGYTRTFQHQDWIDFVDPVQAGGNNGFNERFHALESEFDLISAAIASADSAISGLQSAPIALGLTIVVGIANGATIPAPAGFDPRTETKYFAFVKTYSVDLAQRTGNLASIGFSVVANDSGQVTVNPLNGTTGQTVIATGIAIAKRGGW
jgi:hypothetical protein